MSESTSADTETTILWTGDAGFVVGANYQYILDDIVFGSDGFVNGNPPSQGTMFITGYEIKT